FASRIVVPAQSRGERAGARSAFRWLFKLSGRVVHSPGQSRFVSYTSNHTRSQQRNFVVEIPALAGESEVDVLRLIPAHPAILEQEVATVWLPTAPDVVGVGRGAAGPIEALGLFHVHGHRRLPKITADFLPLHPAFKPADVVIVAPAHIH